MSQGRRANRNGTSVEEIIEHTLSAKGYHVRRQYYIGKSIFDTGTYADLFVEGLPLFPNGLIIESKWQETRGTAEEKVVYLVTNIQNCYPCPTIIIADVGGHRPGVLQWLRRQAGQGRLLAVFSIMEFIRWSNTL